MAEFSLAVPMLILLFFGMTFARFYVFHCATFLNIQGMQVTKFGQPNGYTSRTKVILYSSKLYALRYLNDLFGLESPQIVIHPDPSSVVDI